MKRYIGRVDNILDAKTSAQDALIIKLEADIMDNTILDPEQYLRLKYLTNRLVTRLGYEKLSSVISFPADFKESVNYWRRRSKDYVKSIS